MKLHALLPTFVLLTGAILLTGCEGPAAYRIDPRGPETITTASDLDIQDAADAAVALSQSLLESGHLGRDGRPSTLAISTYVNNTTIHIDRDEIIKKIRVVLNKAGVAQTYTTLGPLGDGQGAEDQFATNRQQQDLAANAQPLPTPDYTLTLKILEKRAVAGKIRQVVYSFQMSMTDLKTGLAVWEEEKQFGKQGAKPAVGW